MREILFRGKRKDNGEWIEGGYAEHDGKSFIVIWTRYSPDTRDWDTVEYYENNPHYASCLIEVIPETVCQYTGLTDKNGRKIFEGGGIVKAEIKINDFSRDSVKNEINTYEVSYHEKYCYFYLERKNNNLLFDGNWSYYLKEIEVIGNIFDNPELIQK